MSTGSGKICRVGSGAGRTEKIRFGSEFYRFIQTPTRQLVTLQDFEVLIFYYYWYEREGVQINLIMIKRFIIYLCVMKQAVQFLYIIVYIHIKKLYLFC